MRYMVVGAGPAGVIAAETLRVRDPAGSVTLVAGEADPPYARMAIPYVLTGKIAEAATHIRGGRKHFAARGIALVQGRASGLSMQGKAVVLDDGKTLPFDRLLVATGASPIRPKVEGLDGPGVHHCWTLADARAIAARAKPGAEVVLIGAGFIACIILESLVARRVKLTVVEMADRMLPRMMDEAGGDLIKRWCEAKGVRVLTGARVTGVERKGKDGKMSVALDRGGPVAADLVVVAAGVKANVDFLAHSGIRIGDGVVVDDRLKSSLDGVYAAGDCAEGPDFHGGWSVHAIQPTATEHGRIAAVNMAGGDSRYHGSVVMNVLDTVGLISTSFGDWQGASGGERAVALDKDRFRYLRLQFADDRLVGALALGLTDHVGALRGLIQTRARLGPWKKKLMEAPERVAEAFVARTLQEKAGLAT